MKSVSRAAVKKAKRRSTTLRTTSQAPKMAGKSPPLEKKDPHVSVMLEQCVDFLRPTPPNIYIDGTLGAGGHTKNIAAALESTDKPGRLFSFDCDPAAFQIAKPILESFPSIIVPVSSRFSMMGEVLPKKYGVKPGSVDGILLDLGVSSMQIDQKERGFAYRLDGPLDMRMDQSAKAATAADYLNKLSEVDLTTLFSHFGIHKMGLSSRVAVALVQKRREIGRFDTTGQLLEVIKSLVPVSLPDLQKKLIKSTFQALRIMVNNEYLELKNALLGAELLLNAHGRLGIISFQSDEAAILKKFINTSIGKRKEADIIADIEANTQVARILSRFGHPTPEKVDSCTCWFHMKRLSNHCILTVESNLAVDMERQVRNMMELAKRRPTFVVTESRCIAPSNSEVEKNPRANSALLHCEIRSIHPPLQFPHTWF